MKKTISHKISKMFIVLVTLTLVLCWIINCTFLVQFYYLDKKDELMNAYKAVNQASITGSIESQEFYVQMEQICGKNNLSLIILDEEEQPVFSTTNAAELFMLHRQILEYIYGYGNNQDEQIVYQDEKVTIQRRNNSHTKMYYMEMWGKLETGGYFLIRTPVESIQESVKLSNQFLMYVGIVAIVLSALVIHGVTKKLTRPIRDLAKISEEMTGLNFEAKYVPNGTIEVDELGDNMNQLSETLEKTISELKTANNELKSDIERKEKIDEMRQEFLANVSHELKTPIALIQGYAEGLMEGAFEDEENKAFYCEVIMDEANKMNNLVKNLLELNQIEFGNEQIAFSRVDIVGLIHGVLSSFKLTCEQRGVQIFFEAKGPVYVWGDEFKIEEVFQNFLTNAIHHAEGEKKIEICVAPWRKNNIEISVFNTGKPIPEEDISRIWEKFYKVDKARTREYGGNGIGLSIVKAIMDSMHKPFGVENFDNGVRFWFVLDGDAMDNQLPLKEKNDRIKTDL